jgi:hypothetical protein
MLFIANTAVKNTQTDVVDLLLKICADEALKAGSLGKLPCKLKRK